MKAATNSHNRSTLPPMYRNSYAYQGIKLGSSISQNDDIFHALEEGRSKAKEIAGLLSIKIPGISPGDIEIRCKSYDPQLWLFDFLKPAPQSMTVQPGAPTLKTMTA